MYSLLALATTLLCCYLFLLSEGTIHATRCLDIAFRTVSSLLAPLRRTRLDCDRIGFRGAFSAAHLVIAEDHPGLDGIEYHSGRRLCALGINTR
jgi:hypothetical protein